MALPEVLGKTAIITGAGSGINLCFAKLVLSKGCNVVFADLSLRPEAQELLHAYPLIASGGKPQAVFQRTNVTSWRELERMFAVCEQHFGSADIVCPGAGVCEPVWSNFWVPPGTAPSADDPGQDHFASFDILITHPVRTTQLAIAHFIKHNKPGSVVHVGSVAAQKAGLIWPFYMTAKHALSGFVRCLADLETGGPDGTLPKIRVTAVAPGVIKTPLWMESPEKLTLIDEKQDAWVEPEEVAQAMYALIVNRDYTGGTVLEVLKNSVRKVKLLNDPGPGTTAGSTASGKGNLKAEVWDRLASRSWGNLHQLK